MASLMAVKLDELTITRKGEVALKKGDHQLAITAKGKAALEKDKKNQNKDPVGKQHEEVEIDELSKKTLGSYVKSASHSAVDSAMALQRTSDKNQSRKDVEKHAGKVVRRQMGISRAANKLSKEDVEMDEIHSPKDRSDLDKAVADFKKKGGEVKKLKPGGRLTGMSKAHRAIHKARQK